MSGQRRRERAGSRGFFTGRRSAKRDGLGGVERLESRAVLSAFSVAIVPPAVPDGPAVVLPSVPVAAVTLSLNVPRQVEAGVPTSITAMAFDAAGLPVPSFSGSAAVSSSDGAAALPMIEVQFKDGQASFTVTFATAGTQTVSVTMLSGDPSAVMSARASTLVAMPPSTMPTAPRTLSSFLISVPAQARAGTAVNASIVALDAAKRPMTNFSGTATLKSIDSAAKLPGSVTFVNGRATARVTFNTPGSQSITVRDAAAGGIVATAATNIVAPQVVTTFSVVLPKAAAVGVPIRVTIVATNAEGRPVPTFSGTATLVSSDGAATFPPSVRFVAGRATVRVTFGTPGEQTLTATTGPSMGGGIEGVGKTHVGDFVTQRIRTLRASKP